ncbi:MAG: ABC transporter permease [Ardenticatenaceae bacterium]|nr:ABC transporter permease [Ardenticatenaceae bacterium]
MTTYLMRRLIQMLIVLLLSSAAIFTLLNAVPGGPFDALRQNADRKSRVTTADIQRLEQAIGLRDEQGNVIPLWKRYLNWLGKAVRAQWGISWKIAQNMPVAFLIKSRLSNTILLMTSATILSLLVAIPIGIYSAVHQYSRADYILTSFSFFGIAMPVFWFGLLLIILTNKLFRDWGLPYLPPGDVAGIRAPLPGSLLAVLGAKPGSILDRVVHLILPTIVLSLLYMASWSRYMRSSMLEVLRQDYVRTARAKGLVERVVIAKHAFRNALIPIVTIVVFQIPGIFSGAVVTETVFNWKGIGRLYIDALFASDWPVVMALLFITAVLVVIANLLADVLYTVVDPRIRYS